MTMLDDRTRSRASSSFALAWGAFLVAGSAIGSLVFACVTPFAALAAVAAMTLKLRHALATAAGVWLANQAIGYGLLAYPVTADSLAWGGVLGLAALAATAVAIAVAARLGDRPEPARWVAALAAALLVQQGVLFAAAGVLGGGDGFTADAVAGVAVIDALWALGLATAHRVATGFARRRALAA